MKKSCSFSVRFCFVSLHIVCLHVKYFKKYQKMTEMVRARTEEQVKAKARSKG